MRTEWLEKVPKSESDHACPHGVQFYDVVIDGTRHERAAWSYEAPHAAMKRIAHRFGFWKNVRKHVQHFRRARELPVYRAIVVCTIIAIAVAILAAVLLRRAPAHA